MSAVMQKQSTLFLDTAKYPSGFFTWLKKNGHIYAAFESMAMRMWRQGRKRYGARTIIEVIRWNTELADSEVMFKINNGYIPGLARHFMEQHPECAGFFETRDHP